MPKQRFTLTLMALSFALATELAIALSWTNSAQAQFKPPNLGPSRETSGISRTNCLRGNTTLTILVPSSKIALTTEARPTFFLNLPKTTAQAAEFVLKGSNAKDVYRTAIVLPGSGGIARNTPGIVSFQLPAAAPPLELGKDYEWYFNLVCEPNNRVKDTFVSAWIQRIEPNQALIRALKTATPRKRPNLYAQAGIWQDTLTTLAELQRTNPSDRTVIKEWSDLLKSVGFGQMTERLSIKQLSPEMLRPQ